MSTSRKKINQSKGKLNKKTRNASYSSESLMKDKDKIWKATTSERRTELRKNTTKWWNSTSLNTGNKLKTLKKNLKTLNKMPNLLRKT